MDNVSSLFVTLGAWNWLILAVLFFVLELAAPGIFLVWFGIAAAIVGGLALLFDVAWQWQLVLFAILSVVAAVAARKFLRTDEVQSEHPLLHRRAQQHIGKSYVVADAIENGRGKVRIGDSLWRVEGPDAEQGSRVKVTGADGTTLLVEPDKG
jgi:membrane protein implicated in regulation of membrane protease activity